MANGNGNHGSAVALTDVHLPVPAQQRGIEPHQWNALKQSVFPGASDNMILLAVDYCRARRLDPLLKPVHIVKTYDTEKNAYVEGVWPGINLHRTTAARTGTYAGMDEPMFGPETTKKLGNPGLDCTYPEWCKVTVYRMVEGQRVGFTSIVFYTETFAQKRGGVPNAMWMKRPRGQLAKCAEADALRKAFPEETGGEPTAEEMDGQPGGIVDVTPPATGLKPGQTRLDALEEIIGPTDPKIGQPSAPPEADAGHDNATAAPSTPVQAPSEVVTDGVGDFEKRLAHCATTADLKSLYFSEEGVAWREQNPKRAQGMYNALWDELKGVAAK